MKLFDETTSSQKTSCRTHKCPTANFLATGGLKFYVFQNACMVYKHAHLLSLHHHIIIGFFINVQVQGHHPHQWAPVQVTG